ncbi:ABC transporter permease [Actinophytocola sp.]|uniref:ABC transporter permease n=1 Tax=Actinophytocola sp. TaxID=1872138 RepID=UPI002EDB1BE1
MSGWRPALRIARRSVRRQLGRSVLIASLIAVPIAGATVMDGLLRTMRGPEYRVQGTMGSADGIAEVTDRLSLPGRLPGTYPQPSSKDPERDPRDVDLAALLPPGSRAVPDVEGYSLRLAQGDRIVRTELNLVTVGDPLTDHVVRLAAGRLPHGPGEALVTESLAGRLGLLDGGDLRPGATVTAQNGPTVAVTGLAVHPKALGLETVVAPPGSALTRSAKGYGEAQRRYLVDLPDGTDPATVWPGLAEHGVLFDPRDLYLNPERYPGQQVVSGGDFVETAGPVALVVGFGVLEVVLLAGAAFAVGARRQVRDLGLIGANGGSAAHVRRTVLAQGLFLGMLGALGGLTLGVLATVLAEPLWERLTGKLIDGWTFGWPELLLAGGIGLLSGLAAALVPAIGVARMRPVDALAQRFRSTRLRTRLPVLGVVLLGVGIAGVVLSGLVARHSIADYVAAMAEGGAQYVPSPDLMLPTAGVLLAGLVAIVGVITVTSGLLGTLARIGGRLPLSGRLAVRDAGRHRHRTVPAIAAIMIVVTGSVTLAFTFAAAGAEDFVTIPDNTVLVTSDPALETNGSTADAVRADLVAGSKDVAGELPGAKVREVPVLFVGEEPVYVGTADETCGYVSGEVGVATPEVLEVATGGKPDAAMRAALGAGKVVTLDDCLIGADGTAHALSGVDGVAPVGLPGYRGHRPEGTSYYALPGAFVSAEKAAALGWRTVVRTTAVTHSATATRDEIDAAIAAAEDNGLSTQVQSNNDAEISAASLGLAAGAGLVTLLGVGVTVALSAAESRADLATLAAIGAQPRRRRTLAGAQAFVLSGLGTALGVAVGGLLGYAVVPLTGQDAMVVPWQNLAVTVAVVPLLAVAVAMLITRANLPMVRRVE